MPAAASPSRTIAALVLCGALVGCATPVVAPALQKIHVRTPGCAVASCELSNDLGRWTLARTPGSVAVSVSREALKVSCRAEDSPTATATARPSRPGTSGVGALTGGATGGIVTGAALGTTALAFIPPLGVVAVLAGAGVGAAAGHAAESHSRPLRYPAVVSLPMSCAATDAASTDPGAPTLGLGIRGLTAAEAQQAGVSGRTAVMVTTVVAQGRAQASGLRAGDVILAANGQDVADAADLEERVLDLPPELPLVLRVWRDGRSVDLVVTRTP